MMKPPPQKSSLLPPLMAGIAVLLFGSASVAHMMEWRPVMPRVSGSTVAATAGAASTLADPAGAALQLADESNAEDGAERPARIRRRCAECGVVESIREIDTGSAAGTAMKRLGRYELTLRLNDGSHQVISGTPAGTWRIGERVIAIAPRQAAIK